MSYTTTQSYKEGIPWQSSGQDLACLVHCQGPGSILGQGTDIPQAMWSGQKKKTPQIFPGGSVVKNLPANEEDTGLTPDMGRSHAEEQLSPSAMTPEPVS